MFIVLPEAYKKQYQTKNRKKTKTKQLELGKYAAKCSVCMSGDTTAIIAVAISAPDMALNILRLLAIYAP